MKNLTEQEKDIVIKTLREKLPQVTKRQLECWILRLLEFTQDECGEILDIDQANVSRNLSNLLDILESIDINA